MPELQKYPTGTSEDSRETTYACSFCEAREIVRRMISRRYGWIGPQILNKKGRIDLAGRSTDCRIDALLSRREIVKRTRASKSKCLTRT